MNKLLTIAKNQAKDQEKGFELGFKAAFNIIDESLNKELNRVEAFPWMGERIMTLKVYQKKIQEILKEMEKQYE